MTWYITTPIYYSSDVPHLGHAYTQIAADFMSRWHRLHGREVHFLTGTDEHGSKMAQAAADHGMTPQHWADEITPAWKELWQKLEITYDDYIRTTQARHKGPVAAFMTKLYESGEIYLDSYVGMYCVRCEEFKTETEVRDGLCPVHGLPVETLSEDNYFFRLSGYTEKLIAHYKANPKFARPTRAYNELMSRLEGGLRDIPISRPSVTWGIPVPWDESHVIYVWIEALQNYITAVGYNTDPQRFNEIWPADVHLIGKEIVWHHAIVWPAMLMAAGVELPKTVFAHGWLLAGGEKISKSGRSITQISPLELVDQFGLDGLRYHFLRGVNFGDDGNFSIEDMQGRHTADLANNLGNLASRTIAMINRYFEKTIPAAKALEEPEQSLRELIQRTPAAADALVSDLQITAAIDKIWDIVRHTNRYLVSREPWKLARDPSNIELVGTVLNTSAKALVCVAGLLAPAMPVSMATLWTRLGQEGQPSLERRDPAGNRVTVGDPLFPRIEE